MLNDKQIVNNEHQNIYLVKRNIDIKKLTLQKEEVAAVKFIDILTLKEKVKNADSNFVIHIEKYKKLFEYSEK